MDIQALKLVVTEADANQLVSEFAPKDLEIDKLQLRFTPEGVRVSGEMPALMFRVSFETLWELSLDAGRVLARLHTLKVAGIPAGKLRGILLKMVRDAVAKHPGITVENEVVCVDPNAILRAHVLPLTIRLTALTCAAGSVLVEAG